MAASLARKCVLKLTAALLVFTASFCFGQAKLVIDKDDYRYSATFDPNRITEQRLRELLLFSPYDMGEVSMLDHHQLTVLLSQTPTVLKKGIAPNSLELCTEGQSRFLPCGTRDITDANFFANAEVNLTINEEAWNAFNRITVPNELQRILKQFRESFWFYKTVESRRLEYLKSGDTRALSEPIGEIAPSKECSETINRIKLATTLQQRYNLSLHSWRNCLNSAWNRTSPAYPNSDWQSFLRDYGITEEFTPKAVD
jgi:hypothetical protein